MTTFGSVTICASLHFLKISLHFRPDRRDLAIVSSAIVARGALLPRRLGSGTIQHP